LKKIKQFWLEIEMRNESSWERFQATFDVSRQFSVDPRSKEVELPISVKANGREDFMLLVRSGALRRPSPAPLASMTVQQVSANGQVVGGSTFVFKAAKGQ